MADRMMNFHSSILQVASIIKNKDQNKTKEKMEMEKKKRDRKANYSKQETDRLADLIVLKKDIVENKKTTADQCTKKREAWEDIEREFNKNLESGDTYRDAKTLRTKYESLKRDVKKKWIYILAKKKNSNGKVPKFSNAEKKIKAIMTLPMEGFCDFNLIDDNRSENDDSSDSSMSNSNIEDLDCSIVKNEATISDEESSNFAYQNIILDEPQSKNLREDPLVGPKHQKNDKSSEPVNKRIRLAQFVDSHHDQNSGNIDISSVEDDKMKRKLQLELLQQEIEIKKLQKNILEEELEHKKTMHQLEKEHFLLKIKTLNNENQCE